MRRPSFGRPMHPGPVVREPAEHFAKDPSARGPLFVREGISVRFAAV